MTGRTVKPTALASGRQGEDGKAYRPGIRPAGRGRQGRPPWHPESMGLARLTAMPSIRQAAYGKADRCGLSAARLTVMARFSALWAAFSCDLWHNPRSRKFLGHLGIVRSAIAVNLAIREPYRSALPQKRRPCPAETDPLRHSIKLTWVYELDSHGFLIVRQIMVSCQSACFERATCSIEEEPY